MQDKNKKVFFRDWGLIDYKEGWDLQTTYFNKIINRKIANRDLPEAEKLPTSNYLFFCEHPHVFTLGRNGKEHNLLATPELLSRQQASYYEINRGGDITYHGPGQLVGYPVLDLDNFFTDIHRYLRFLEEAVIRTVSEYGVEAGRIEGLTGVWVEYDKPALARKICAFGVKTSRWVTMHGLGFNVNTDLSYFKNIIACGIQDKGVTSLARETGRAVDMKEVADLLKKNIGELFEMEFVDETAF